MARIERLRAAIVLPVVLLAACGAGDDAPGTTSAGEAQALNDAAAMLDANSVDANAVVMEDENEAQPQ